MIAHENISGRSKSTKDARSREERDYAKYCKLAGSSEDLTSQENEWVNEKSIGYIALLLALEDYFENYKGDEVLQSNHSVDWWERWARKLSDDELDAEHARLLIKCNTQICPWLDQQKELV